MQKPCIGHARWKCFLLLVIAACPAFAEENRGGGDLASAIEWNSSYWRAVNEADRDGKLILVGVTASWCGPCRQLKQSTFKDSRVVDIVRSDFVALSIDADQHPDLVAGFRVESYPTMFVVAPDRTILKRMTGYQSPESLVSTLTSIAKTQSASKPVIEFSEAISALEPANDVKFGFDGFCLVTLLEDTRIRKGSSEFQAEHRGQTLCFQSDEQRQKFLTDPDKYWPVADGNCLVSTREGSLGGPGDPRMAVTWRGRIWMFSNRVRQQRFIQAPFDYSNEMWLANEM